MTAKDFSSKPRLCSSRVAIAERPSSARPIKGPCSPECIEEFRATGFKAHNAKKHAALPRLKKYCQHCQKPFIVIWRGGSKVYCSKECKNAARVIVIRERRRAKNLKPCIICSKPTIYVSCSDECRAQRRINERKSITNKLYDAAYNQHKRATDPEFRAKSRARLNRWKSTPTGENYSWEQVNKKRQTNGRSLLSFEDWKQARMIRIAKRELKKTSPNIFKQFYGADQYKVESHRRYHTNMAYREKFLVKSSKYYYENRKPKMQLLWGAYKFFRSINVLPPIQGGNQKAQAAKLALTEAARAGIKLPPNLVALIPPGSGQVKYAA